MKGQHANHVVDTTREFTTQNQSNNHQALQGETEVETEVTKSAGAKLPALH